MASPSSLVFSVIRQMPKLVKPEKPTPRELKSLSDIDDQQGLRFHVRYIMSYPNNSLMKGKDPVRVISDAMAEALVYYYPLAGRLREGHNQKLMVDCTGEGVLFVEADADVKLDQLGDAIQPPCPYIAEFLHEVPGSSGILACPLLLIQVTRLTCGGFITAARLNHTISDSLGFVQFLNAIGEIARGHEQSQLPVWQREILYARDPPRITCAHHEYENIPKEINNTNVKMDQNNMAHCSFFFGPKQIRSIRMHLPPHLRESSSNFDVITSCLWKCRTIALEVNPEEIVRLSCMINARGKRGIAVPPGYYGNAFAFPTTISRAKLICENPLGYTLQLVKKTKTLMSEEYIRSVADLMVIEGRPHYTTTLNYLVADSTQVGFKKVDFGWGKPVYGGQTGAISCISFYVRAKNSEGESGILVPIILPLLVMQRFQEELEKMAQEPTDHQCYGLGTARIRAMI